MKRKPIQILHKKLGRSKFDGHNVDGLAYKDDRVIEIDSRLKGKDHLETIIHEVCHLQNPKWGELMVQGRSKELSDILWELGYRRVDL